MVLQRLRYSLNEITTLQRRCAKILFDSMVSGYFSLHYDKEDTGVMFLSVSLSVYPLPP